jgi:hypothetical protein
VNRLHEANVVLNLTLEVLPKDKARKIKELSEDKSNRSTKSTRSSSMMEDKFARQQGDALVFQDEEVGRSSQGISSGYLKDKSIRGTNRQHLTGFTCTEGEDWSGRMSKTSQLSSSLTLDEISAAPRVVVRRDSSADREICNALKLHKAHEHNTQQVI